jgi:hypothetical protein
LDCSILPSRPPHIPYSTFFCDEDEGVSPPDDKDKGVGSPYDENKSAGLPYNEDKGVEVEVGFAVDGVAVIRPNDRNHPHALQCPGGANSKKITRKGLSHEIWSMILMASVTSVGH